MDCDTMYDYIEWDEKNRTGYPYQCNSSDISESYEWFAHV
jgi:hypothetical protein